MVIGLNKIILKLKFLTCFMKWLKKGIISRIQNLRRYEQRKTNQNWPRTNRLQFIERAAGDIVWISRVYSVQRFGGFTVSNCTFDDVETGGYRLVILLERGVGGQRKAAWIKCDVGWDLDARPIFTLSLDRFGGICNRSLCQLHVLLPGRNPGLDGNLEAERARGKAGKNFLD